MDKYDGDIFMEECALSGALTALEIGVGTGRLAIRIAPKVKSLVGIDLSPMSLIRAKENFRVNNISSENLTLICGDFTEYDFACSFGLIYSTLTFMHIENKAAAIDKIFSLLEGGGKLVLALDKSREEYIDFGSRKIKIYPDTPENIIFLLKERGFTGIRQRETEFSYVVSAKKV